MIPMRLAPTMVVGLMLAPCFARAATLQEPPAASRIVEPADQGKFSVADLAKGDRLPTTLKPSNLPDGYRAFRIRASGESGFSEFFGSPLGMLMLMPMGARRTRETTSLKLFDLLDLAWTKGDVVQLVSPGEHPALDGAGIAEPSPNGESYLVTYKADLSVSDLMALSEHPSQASEVSLKLHLIKFKSITAFVPEAQYSKESYAEALGMAGAEVEKQPSASDSARRTAGLSNAKQIDLGLLMYCTDNDDDLPFVQSTAEVKAAILPYTKNDALWNTLNPKSQFRFNMCLSGVAQTAVESPADTPMIYESAPGTDGKRIVAFADGHAKLVPETEWPAMAKYLKLKLKRATKASAQPGRVPVDSRPLPPHPPVKR